MCITFSRSTGPSKERGTDHGGKDGENGLAGAACKSWIQERREFADSIGMNLSTYTKYEQGSRGINLEQAREFADALKCRLDDLADMPSDATESAEEAPKPSTRARSF